MKYSAYYSLLLLLLLGMMIIAYNTHAYTVVFITSTTAR